jgi:hypothetical protein
MKFLFMPLSIATGLVAGMIGKRLFEHVWSWIDEEEPPDPKHREATWTKVIAAAALQGAVFRAVRALADRGSRVGFANVTGSWPGEEEPDREP